MSVTHVVNGSVNAVADQYLINYDWWCSPSN